MNFSSPLSPPRAQALSMSAPSPLWKRRQRVLAVGFLLVWPAFYAATSHAMPFGAAPAQPAPMTLRVGKSLSLPLAPGETFSIERGASLARCESSENTLFIHALSPGLVTVRIQNSKGGVERVAYRFVEATARPILTSAPMPQPTLLAQNTGSTVSPMGDDPLSNIPAIPSGLIGKSSTAGSPAISPQPGFGATQGQTISPVANPNGANNPTIGTASPSSPITALPSPAPSIAQTRPSVRQTRPSTTQTRVPASTRTPRPAQSPAADTLPPARGPQVQRSLPPSPPPRSNRSSAPARTGTTRISPVVLPPTTRRRADVPYRTIGKMPQNVPSSGPRPSIEVTQGLARLVSFPDNILSVFFSDPGVMDARAINARTIAVTGTGVGTSTLAVFTSRYSGDAVGRANIYRVGSVARGGSGAAQAMSRDPKALEEAINAALGDPRVTATVVRLPDGSLVGRLQGIVRNEAEVTGAASTASFYVPRVVSSLYADINAPTIEAVKSGNTLLTPTETLQDNLRRLTGNPSIELVSLPTGLALKASTDSTEEAEAILRILPSLNQAVVPFIVVHGLANSQSPYYNSDVPLLQGEDRQLTDKLQAVTGVRTVYAVRASSNSIAIYGQVRTRGEYETVKRYGLVIAQLSNPVAAQGTGQGGSVERPQGLEPPPLPGYDPAAGYLRQLGVQMFVRILDPSQATVRNVTVETNVVEISRTALDNLGLQFGSAQTTSENITPSTPGTVTVLRDAANNPVIGADGRPVTTTTGGTPGTITRSINPTFQQGLATAGNGFAGLGPTGFLDPFRVQLNLLSNRGDARILARPNVRAMEGTAAQITIGGERPVPSAVATTGATAQSVEFRRFGVIISMRPTVSDDNTIILQIRADITQPDLTYAINLNGAIIPGETVRSVDTTLAVRAGDVIVMGGLMTNEKRTQTTKIPILGDLPIIGALFKSKRFENNETELAIFMTPRLDFLPATETTEAILERGPALPGLPSRQESNGILFQQTSRSPG